MRPPVRVPGWVAAHLDRFIVVNRPLLGPVPYWGELGIEAGLFSLEAVDLAKLYLELLSELTEKATVSFLAQAAPFVEPIKRGAALLLGNGNTAGDCPMEYALHRSSRSDCSQAA